MYETIGKKKQKWPCNVQLGLSCPFAFFPIFSTLKLGYNGEKKTPQKVDETLYSTNCSAVICVSCFALYVVMRQILYSSKSLPKWFGVYTGFVP